MALRVVGVSHHSLEVPYVNYPYRLADLLRRAQEDVTSNAWEERIRAFVGLSPCVLDAFTASFKEAFPSCQSIKTERCQTMLHCLCHQLDMTTHSTERQHAKTGRRAHSRSTTHHLQLGHAAVFQSQGVPLFCENFKRLQAEGVNKRRFPSAQGSQHQKKRKGSGGPWRAYVHIHGQGNARPDLQVLAAQYNGLEEAQKAVYKEMGSHASWVARAGGRAFPQTQQAALRVRQKAGNSEHTLDAILAGGLLAQPQS